MKTIKTITPMGRSEFQRTERLKFQFDGVEFNSVANAMAWASKADENTERYSQPNRLPFFAYREEFKEKDVRPDWSTIKYDVEIFFTYLAYKANENACQRLISEEEFLLFEDNSHRGAILSYVRKKLLKEASMKTRDEIHKIGGEKDESEF